MTKFIPFITLLAFVSLFAACSAEKCYECTALGVTSTVCEGDYASATEFEAFVDVLRTSGSTCTVK